MLRAAAICPPCPVLLPGISGHRDPAGSLRAASVAAVRRLLDQGCARLVVVAPGESTRTWPRDAPFSTGVFTGAGGPPPEVAMPTSLAVARHLLELAGWSSTQGAVSVREASSAREVSARSAGIPAASVLDSLGLAVSPTDALVVDAVFQAVAVDAHPDWCRRLGSELVAGPEPVGLLVMADGTVDHDLPDPPQPLTEADAFDEALVRALREGDPELLGALDTRLGERWGSCGRVGVAALVGACSAAPRQARVTFAEAPFGVFYVVANWEFTLSAEEIRRSGA